MRRFISILKLTIVIAAFAAFLATPTVYAEDCADTKSCLSNAVKDTLIADKGNFPLFVGGIIKSVIAALGIIFLIMILYGGFLWMTAMGDDTKIKTAKSLIAGSLAGLLVVLASYAITNFVITSLINIK